MKKLRYISLLVTFLLLMVSNCLAGSIVFNKDTLYKVRHVIVVQMSAPSDTITLSAENLKDCMGMMLFSIERVPATLGADDWDLTVTSASGKVILSDTTCDQTAVEVDDYLNYPIREGMTIAVSGLSTGSVSIVLTFTS